MAEVETTPARARVETRLDDLVRGNRFVISVVFPVVGAVLLVASAESLLGPLAYNPYLILAGVVVMRLPLVAGVAPLLDRRATAALLALTLYAYGIEYLGVTTGWPYGEFEYAIDLGPMLFGAIPVGLPVFFFPLVLNSYLLCLLLLGGRADRARVRLPVVVLAVLGMDLVLDPAAVSVGFWRYAGGGAYYGVPLSNYLGWVLSATVAVAAFDLGFERAGLRHRLRECEFMLDDLVSFVLLWGPINAYFGNWVPVGVAALFGLGLLYTDRFDFDVRDSIPGLGAR
ncbi:bisanhydrobacterioruberin hydratase [Halomarina pelagica]|uniref:bisanhydrobacterioruberin hydratase n=1 Tax=Halomarina pelagica TaxID=2961599 RepID=UPI0020C2604A|nr:bisanhydrobacterioruberin hydratase [Halomarina sp. BND7]